MKVKLSSGHEIYLDSYLVNALDSLIYNVKNDWDFVIIITGDRMVRTGKSVLAINICAYLADKLKTKYNLNNIFFDSQEMIDKVHDFPQYSVIHYDEGREGLAANKSGQQLQKDILDYFAECGQLNHVFVVVLPDYFELKENMAVARSECLINVYRNSREVEVDIYKDGQKKPVVKFDRGYFEFFNRDRKESLYDRAKSTRRKSYSLIKANFRGRFTNNYGPIDEEGYREKKRNALARFKEKKKEEHSAKATDIFRDRLVLKCHNNGMVARQIAKKLELEYDYKIGERRIQQIIKKFKNP